MKSEHIAILVLLIVIIILLLWVIVNTYTVRPTVSVVSNKCYNKANAFIQDLCTQINEDMYVVLLDNKSRVEGRIIYIVNDSEKEMYEEIIELLSYELHKRSSEEKEVIKKKLEQIAYNLGYLICTVNCSK